MAYNKKIGIINILGALQIHCYDIKRNRQTK